MYCILTFPFSQEILSLDSDSPSEIPVPVHNLAVSREAPFVTRGSFDIDTTLGRDTTFGIIVPDSNDYFIKSVRFFDSEGKQYGPYDSISSDFNSINLKTVNFAQGTLAPPFDDVSLK